MGWRAQGLEISWEIGPHKRGGFWKRQTYSEAGSAFPGASGHLFRPAACISVSAVLPAGFPLPGAPGSSWWLCLTINSPILPFPRL